MIHYKTFAMFLFLLITMIFSSNSYQAMAEENFTETKKNLEDYLNTHWKSPEDYVIDKFSDHDIVIIGEVHGVKHDVELIHHLIPRLYKNGIYNLGIEFGSYEYQNKVDELINGKVYDENLARWILFKNNPIWGYKEYMDIYREAWNRMTSVKTTILLMD